MPEPPPPPTRRVTVIRNPGARRPPREADLDRALDAIRRSGWTATVVDTTARGDATRVARAAAADGVDVVVACGGDGTVNETADGLIGSDTALALIPSGTANVWAREVGIDSDPASALGLLDAGRRVRVDSGIAQIGDGPPRTFLLMCSVGIDAATVRTVEQRPGMKRRFGRAAFGWPGIQALFARAVETTLTSGDTSRDARLLMAVAGNSQLYGSVIRLTGDARMDDGELDLVTFEDARGGARRVPMHRSRLLVRALRGGLHTATTEGIQYSRTSAVELRPHSPLAVQADGEFIGEAGPDAPLRLSVAPRSLTVLVPGGVNPLFDRGADR